MVLVNEREAGHRRAEARSDVAHEHLRGRRVPPQEPETGAHHRGRHDGEVEGTGGEHVVDGRVAELPEADDHERGEHHRRRAGGQPVHAVGEVDRVGEAVDEEHRDDEPEADAI